MARTPREHWQLRAANAAFVVLFLAIVGLLLWLSREYHLRFDLTQTSRHSLSAASIAVLGKISGPVRITAYASERGEVRATLRTVINRYQRHKPDIELVFVDPDSAPEKTREAGVQYDGELVIEYGPSREQLPPQRLAEEHLTNALQRLARRGERWVVFLTGHGERSPDRQANFDLSVFAAEMRKRGFQTRAHSLGEQVQLPQNTSLLVIAGPRTRLLTGELRAIETYLKGGGNLLWLHDPGPLNGMERLAEQLGIEFQPGVAVDPVSAAVTGQATALVVARYGAHPAVRNFNEQTLFVHAAGIHLQTPAGWHSETLIDTLPSSWSETGGIGGEMQFDQGRDLRGPLTLGVALTRENATETGENREGGAGREQRVAVLGDGDFLSNTYLANAGNLEFGMSLVNWLSRDDAFVNIPVRTAPDRTLNLSQGAQIAIALVFLVLLPLTFAAAGVAVWWRRRKR